MKNYKVHKMRMSKKNFYLAVVFIVLSTVLIIAVSIKRSLAPSNNVGVHGGMQKAVTTESVKNNVKKSNIQNNKNNINKNSNSKSNENKSKFEVGNNEKALDKAEPTQAKKEDVKKDNLKKEEKKSNSINMINPVEGSLFQKFSNDKLVFHEKTGVFKTHNGIDIQTKPQTPVKAVLDGTVVNVADNTGIWDMCVTIEHKGGLKTVYKGLGENLNVKEGFKVKAGEVIGAVSGKLKQSDDQALSHFYFEVTKDGKYVDPLKYLKY